MKVISLFSGAGAMDLGFKRQGFEIIWANDFEKAACNTYAKNIGDHILHKNILEIDSNDIPDCDGVIGGSPCFEKGTLVMTSEGYKNVENIAVGDLVLTHNNRFEKVLKIMERLSENILEIDIMGSSKFKATEEHPFYAKSMSKEYNSKIRNKSRVFSEPSWVEAKDLEKGHYIGVAVNQKSTLPIWDGIVSKVNKNTNKSVNNLNFNDLDLWWIIGRYLGDGWTNLHKRKDRDNSYIYKTVICCSLNEVDELEQVIKKVFSYTKVKEKTIYKFQITNEELFYYLQQFGKGASNKKLTSDVFDLPIDLLKSFIEGYVSADGSFNSEKKIYKISSTSQELIYGIGACINKAYKVHYSLSKNIMPKTTIIQGRTVNQKDFYQLQYYTDMKKNCLQITTEDGYIWVPFKGKELIKHNDFVYNFEVENDNSYTVFNYIVHNCQGFSNSNRFTNFLDNPKNFLVKEFIRVVKDKNPKFFVLENVPQIITAGNGKFAQEIIDELSEYHIEIKILNSVDYDSAQKRRRAIFIGSKNGIIKHPEPISKIHKTVGDALQGLNDNFPNQTDYTKSSDLVKERMSHVRQGNNWADIPQEIRGNMIKGRTHSSLYRRLKSDEPSITITNFRKVLLTHPTEDRNITVREAARIQGFPDDFIFHGTLSEKQQMVANAVPVELSEAIAGSIKNAIIHRNINIQ